MILSISTISTTLKEWIEKAKTFHAQKMSIATIRGRRRNPSFFMSRNPPLQDPNTMDVNAVSAEWAHYIREKCFRCQKPGHGASQHNQSSPCPQNVCTTDTSTNNSTNPSPPSNTTPAPVSTIEAYVQNLKTQGKDKAEVL